MCLDHDRCPFGVGVWDADDDVAAFTAGVGEPVGRRDVVQVDGGLRDRLVVAGVGELDQVGEVLGAVGAGGRGDRVAGAAGQPHTGRDVEGTRPGRSRSISLTARRSPKFLVRPAV